MGDGLVTLHLLRDDQDDQGDYIPSRKFQDTMEQPDELAGRQADEAREFIARVRAGGHLHVPWPDLDRLIGPLLPGWLLAVGGRGKAGKTTFMRDLLTFWVELGKTVVYVGTETEASILRLAWAATRLGIPVETALDPYCPEETHQKLMADVSTQTNGILAYRAIFGECTDATIGDLAHWVEYARVGKADALIFDHLGRMDVGQGEQWQGMGNAVRQIKNMAKSARMVVVMGAQLTQGEGGSWLGEHEIPGNKSWAGTAAVQRECDVGIQLWRPFKPGITADQKRQAKDDEHKVRDLVQENTMAVRIAAHRWRGRVMNECSRLYVENDAVHSFSTRMTP
jgi:hypothetical protein